MRQPLLDGKPEVNHSTLGLQGWRAGLEEVLLHALSHLPGFGATLAGGVEEEIQLAP